MAVVAAGRRVGMSASAPASHGRRGSRGGAAACCVDCGRFGGAPCPPGVPLLWGLCGTVAHPPRLACFPGCPRCCCGCPPPPPVLFASLPSTALVFCSKYCSCFLFLSCPQKVRSAPATAVAWAPDGGRYLLVTDKVVSVYLATGKLAASLEHPKRVLAAVFTSPVGVATAGEERVIKVRWGMGGWGGCA